MRSKVSTYEQIRRAHDRDGLSIRALSQRFRVHRRDVRQALASALPRPGRSGPAAPKMDRWKPVVERWLEEDRAMPRKQRHTATGPGSAWSKSSAPTWRDDRTPVRGRRARPPTATLIEVMVPSHTLATRPRSTSAPRRSTWPGADRGAAVHHAPVGVGTRLSAGLPERGPGSLLGRPRPGLFHFGVFLAASVMTT